MTLQEVPTPRILALFVLAAFNFAFALFVYLAHREGRANRNYFFFIACVALWSLFLGLFYLPGAGAAATFWSNAIYFAGTMIATFFLLFCLEFSEGYRLGLVPKVTVFVPAAVLFVLYFFTPLVISGVEFRDEVKSFVYGSSLHFLFDIHFASYVVAGFAALYHQARRGNRQRKIQVAYIFGGTLFAYLYNAYTNVFLPSFLEDDRLMWIGPYATTPMIVVIAYAIVRYQAFQARVVAPQMLVAAIVITLLFEAILSATLLSLIVRLLLLAAASYAGYLLVRAIGREVSQRTRLQELSAQLQRANAELSRANEEIKWVYAAKSEFLDIASHQLRTPVSLIVGTLDMLREGSLDKLLPEKHQEFLERAYLKAQKLNSVITDVLSAAEMDVPQFDISGTAKSLDLRAVAERVVRGHEGEARERGLALTLKAPAAVQVIGSEQYLVQALSNFVSNAIKYTKEGSVTVEVRPEGDEAVVAVRDTGIGVPKEDLPKLWEKFARARNAREMYTDGSGLGLFIVKKIIEAHPGGRIFAKSTLGKGSTFGLRLPIVKA